ncbi:SCO6880 family protein, partial [Okeania sp. SIO2B9]|uniref:SCO6880 family protein n=1 Tax=Okeania sp. SIO2B9 TaxID=2607782 RepID=UPI0014297DE2
METALVAFFLFMAIMTWGWARVLVWPAVVGLLVSVVLVSRVTGVAVWSVLWQELAWTVGGLRGRGRWISPLVAFDSGNREGLPGPLARKTMFEVDHGGGRPYGALFDQVTREITVTFVGNAQTVALADADEVDLWVANWNQFLGGLSATPQISWVSVTVSTALDQSGQVASQIGATMRGDAPDLSR